MYIYIYTYMHTSHKEVLNYKFGVSCFEAAQPNGKCCGPNVCSIKAGNFCKYAARITCRNIACSLCASSVFDMSQWGLSCSF